MTYKIEQNEDFARQYFKHRHMFGVTTNIICSTATNLMYEMALKVKTSTFTQTMTRMVRPMRHLTIFGDENRVNVPKTQITTIDACTDRGYTSLAFLRLLLGFKVGLRGTMQRDKFNPFNKSCCAEIESDPYEVIGSDMAEEYLGYPRILAAETIVDNNNIQFRSVCTKKGKHVHIVFNSDSNKNKDQVNVCVTYQRDKSPKILKDIPSWREYPDDEFVNDAFESSYLITGLSQEEMEFTQIEINSLMLELKKLVEIQTKAQTTPMWFLKRIQRITGTLGIIIFNYYLDSYKNKECYNQLMDGISNLDDIEWSENHTNILRMITPNKFPIEDDIPDADDDDMENDRVRLDDDAFIDVSNTDDQKITKDNINQATKPQILLYCSQDNVKNSLKGQLNISDSIKSLRKKLNTMFSFPAHTRSTAILNLPVKYAIANNHGYTGVKTIEAVNDFLINSNIDDWYSFDEDKEEIDIHPSTKMSRRLFDSWFIQSQKPKQGTNILYIGYFLIF